MREVIVAVTSFFLLGGFIGWIVGHTVGTRDGIEAEKRRAVGVEEDVLTK